MSLGEPPPRLYNVGWIRLASSSGAHPFVVKTSWNCDPAPVAPSGSPGLALVESGTDAQLTWDSLVGATGYDVVVGDLATLRSSGGDYALATSTCLSNNRRTTSETDSSTPAASQGVWFLVRGENCGGAETYDSGEAAQIGPRDSAIAASGNGCP